MEKEVKVAIIAGVFAVLVAAIQYGPNFIHPADPDKSLVVSSLSPDKQSPPQSKEVYFGSSWGKLILPVRAKVGIIDTSPIPNVGLSAMQLDNIDFNGKYNAVVVGFTDKSVKAHVYNAWGLHAMEGDEVRISSALADELGCGINEYINIESLAVISN